MLCRLLGLDPLGLLVLGLVPLMTEYVSRRMVLRSASVCRGLSSFAEEGPARARTHEVVPRILLGAHRQHGRSASNQGPKFKGKVKVKRAADPR